MTEAQIKNLVEQHFGTDRVCDFFCFWCENEITFTLAGGALEFEDTLFLFNTFNSAEISSVVDVYNYNYGLKQDITLEIAIRVAPGFVEMQR